MFLAITDFYTNFKTFLDNTPAFAEAISVIVRYLFPLLSVFILSGAFLSLLMLPKRPEAFAKIRTQDGKTHRITGWECMVGRSRSTDIVLSYPTVSRLHAVISRRETDEWTIYDLDSKHGILVNGVEIDEQAPLHYGDEFTLGAVTLQFLPISKEEQKHTDTKRRQVRPIPPWSLLLLLTIMQIFLCVQLCIEKNETATGYIVPVFALYTLVMWLYFVLMRLTGVRGFELEIIAFYLTTISLSVTTSCNYTLLPKQLIAVVLGLLLFLSLGFLLRDLSKVQKLRWAMSAFAVILMASTLLLGQMRHGATNWIRFGPLSFQPSELAKLCFIFAGSATLERLFKKRNLGLFMLLSLSLMLCLGLMNDFGTAAIFFVTFLVIAFLRSGDFATILLICGGAVSAGSMILIAKPYIWARFSTWGHAFEYASGGGYQQTRTLTAIANGGLLGLGPGAGSLKRVAAADTDLVFGMICEEWGLLVACMAVLCIIVLAAFAIKSCSMSRSSFYTIAACSATSMLVFQMALNIFGSVDILPLTGVTFPFVSNGGSSMLLSYGLSAYLKSTDTRPGASFVSAITKSARKKQPSKKGGHAV